MRGAVFLIGHLDGHDAARKRRVHAAPLLPMIAPVGDGVFAGQRGSGKFRRQGTVQCVAEKDELKTDFLL